jgi:hypothetical protein
MLHRGMSISTLCFDHLDLWLGVACFKLADCRTHASGEAAKSLRN